MMTSPAPRKSTRTVPSFVVKLFNIVCNPLTNRICCWSENGKSFKSKNIDTTSATFTEETRAMAKRAFKASMAVADIEDAEMEELLKETSKKEASDQLDAAYDSLPHRSINRSNITRHTQRQQIRIKFLLPIRFKERTHMT